MDMNSFYCTNNLRCWECSADCPLKSSCLISEELFIALLRKARPDVVGYYMLLGLSMSEAEEKAKIVELSLIVARRKIIEISKKK